MIHTAGCAALFGAVCLVAVGLFEALHVLMRLMP